jgi:hypothetical protein
VKTLSGAVLSALASGSVAIVQLVELVFTSGTIRLNSSNWNLIYGGDTYTGAYGLGNVSAVTDQPGEVQGVTLVLSGGDPLRIAQALDSSDEVQGAIVRIRTCDEKRLLANLHRRVVFDQTDGRGGDGLDRFGKHTRARQGDHCQGSNAPGKDAGN